MAKKSSKKSSMPERPKMVDADEMLHAGRVREYRRTRTLDTNDMPYAISVIVRRSQPEIDGFKREHRKLLCARRRDACAQGPRHQV